MLYPLSYEGGSGQVSRTTRANRLGPRARRPARMGRWPIRSCSSRSGWRPPSPPSPAGRSTRSCGRRTAPTPRPTAPSPWPRSWAGRPRELAQAVIDAADLSGICRDVELAGPGFINLTFDDGYLARTVAAVADRRATRGPPAPTTRARRHRLLGSERRQGDARRAPAHDRSSATRWPACSTFARPHRHPGEPHRRLGHAVRHADRAPGRRRRGRGRARAVASATSTASTSRPATKFDADEEFRERARQRVVAAAGRRSRHARACGAAWSTRAPATSTRSTGGSASSSTDDGPDGRERLQRRCCPRSSERLDEAGLLRRVRRRARSSSRPASPNRDGEPLPLIVRKADGGFNYATTDLATRDRPRRAGRRPRCSLYVVGAPQAQHLADGVRRRGGGGLAAAAGAGRARAPSATCSGPTTRCCAAAAARRSS